MKFEVYCDESRQDLFTTEERDREKYFLIGSLWLPSEKREIIKSDIKDIRNRHKINSEFKWQKASVKQHDFYLDLISLFLNHQLDLRFRCIAVEVENVNLIKYHENDQELGFYKFYYQMLHHWIYDFNEYSIFCDLKSNRIKNRLQTLGRCIQNSNLSSQILQIQALPSYQVDLLQMADLLLGLTSSRLNGVELNNKTKIALIEHLESGLGRERLRHTNKREQKFNIFVINLHGGW